MKVKYKFGFEIWGIVLFLAIMVPNMIWSVVPAPDDVLRKESLTPLIDNIASLFQVLMIASMCFLKNDYYSKLKLNSPLIFLTAVMFLLYFVMWIIYYIGIVNSIVILGLCVFPCLAFLFFMLGRRNYIAIIPLTVFSLCHLAYTVINYII